MTMTLEDRLYVGHSDGRVTVNTLAGDEIGPLQHHVRHSPAGFNWGYCGSGPADLARCLLIDTLGDRAMCGTCRGTNDVVYDDERRCERPFDAEVDGATDSRASCIDCGGDRVSSVVTALYQTFKRDVVAKFPQCQGWRLRRSEVMAWVTAHEPATAGIPG